MSKPATIRHYLHLLVEHKCPLLSSVHLSIDIQLNSNAKFEFYCDNVFRDKNIIHCYLTMDFCTNIFVPLFCFAKEILYEFKGEYLGEVAHRRQVVFNFDPEVKWALEVQMSVPTWHPLALREFPQLNCWISLVRKKTAAYPSTFCIIL